MKRELSTLSSQRVSRAGMRWRSMIFSSAVE
jgi:hypothetical protein